MHWDPEQWSYRAEGGKHIVVYNSVARKVLRIIKADRGTSVSAESDKLEIERRLRFEKLVIGPLLGDYGLEADSGTLVWLPKQFISTLSKRIEKERPIARRGKVIPSGDRYAVLQRDFCNSINQSTLPNIGLELKPKQLVKIRRGKYESRSAYCPVDLFSSRLDRKRFALAQLIQNPQNNLRFFLGGKLIYSMETMEHKGMVDCAKHFPAALEEVCGLSGAFELVLDQLCNQIGSCNISSNEFCQASTYQANESSDLCPLSGPLQGITKLQKISCQSANDVLESFNRLTKRQKEELEYPNKSWCKSARKKPTDELTDVDIVRRHLISATAKDCSLIIVFNPPSVSNPNAHFRMEIVDMDLKPPSKLSEHVQKEIAWSKFERSSHTSYQ